RGGREMGKKIRFGITAPVPGESVERLIKFAADAENAGFDTVWFPDHVVFMAKRITPEVWSVITAASMKTKSVIMGTVGDSHRMHPAVFAHRLATVDHVSNGRIFVCVGYGEKMNLDPYGIKWNKPLTRVVESIKIMRALWKGEPVDFDGELYSMSQAELRIQPVRDNRIPIYVAATGPRALKVAGEYGDGWVTNAMPPSLFARKLESVLEGAAGRDAGLGEIEKTIYMFTSIAENVDEAYKSLEPVKHALIWPELLSQAGYDIKIDEEYQGLEYTKIMPGDQDMLRKFREMGEKYYSRDIVLDFVAAGSKEDVIKRLEEYVDAGVEHFIFRDFSPDREKSFTVLSKDIAGYFRG
ncbi:MAG: LLM class flavin-dependent oxidoreductase, partial [Candidatus Dadabacteria bacterium]|nr:LLM class flavin-dependent oxidoreductase [Candidatus Dadabacteria bacterium]